MLMLVGTFYRYITAIGVCTVHSVNQVRNEWEFRRYLQTNSCGKAPVKSYPLLFLPVNIPNEKKALIKRKIQRWNFMNKLVCAVRLFSNKSAKR